MPRDGKLNDFDDDASAERTNSSSFARLWQAHRAEIYARCLSWMQGHRENAEEALSRTCTIALRKFPAVSAELRDPLGWLMKLAYHACIDLYREKRRRREEPLDDFLAPGSERAPRLQIPETPETLLLRGELLGQVISSLDSLPAPLREPMRLYSFDEMDYRRIAKALRLTEANVRKRVQHARRLMRRQLAAYGSSAPAEGPAPPPAGRQSVSPTPVGHEVLPAVRGILPVAISAANGERTEAEIWLLHQPVALGPRRLAALRAYIARHPTGWKKRLELARTLVETGHCEEALDHFRFVANKRRDRTEVPIELGMLLLNLGRSESAAEAFALALPEIEAPAHRALLRGLIDHCRGARDTARASLREAVAELPRSLTARLLQARTALAAGEVGEAIEACGAALALAPESVPALLLGHDALLRGGRPAAALTLLACAAELAAEDPAVRRRLARHRR